MFRIFICTATADAYFRTGRYKHALVIGAETLSKMMNWADRSTCVLFGDGAGAAVVSAEGSQLLSMVQGSDGAGGMALHCENRPVNNLYRQLGAQHYAFTQMDGREVYKFACARFQRRSVKHLNRQNFQLKM